MGRRLISLPTVFPPTPLVTMGPPPTVYSGTVLNSTSVQIGVQWLGSPPPQPQTVTVLYSTIKGGPYTVIGTYSANPFFGPGPITVTGLNPSTTYWFSCYFTTNESPPRNSQAIPSISLTTPAASAVNYLPGLHREDSAQIRGYGSNYSTYSTPNDLATTLADSKIACYWSGCNWGCFESATQGVYDWTFRNYISSQCEAAGKFYGFFIHGEAVPFVTQANAYAQSFVPSYLNDAGGANVFGGLQNIYFGSAYGGCVPMLGRAAVINAYCNMVNQFLNTTDPYTGLTFKNNPHFLGICTWETAYNLGQAGYPNFTGIDASWGTNQANWFSNYANLVMPNLRSYSSSTMFLTRANYNGGAGAAQLSPIAAAALTNLWACSGGTDCTQDPSDMTKVLNGSVGGIDYRPSLPILLFTESNGNVGGTTGESHNGGPWTAGSSASNLVAAWQDPTAWGADAVIPLRYAGDGWTSTFASIESAYTAAGSHFARSTPPTGWSLI